MGDTNISDGGLGDFESFMKGVKEWQMETSQNLNDIFLVTMAIVVFFLQAGFALLEAGTVRSKNVTNILIKNLLDAFVAGLSYWLVGFAFAHGDGNSYIGWSYIAHVGLPPEQYSFWLFHYVFAATAATIVSGAVAERCDFKAYLIYSFFITGFVYPVVSRWVWHPEGWLLVGTTYTSNDGETVRIGYTDFSGSGALHSLSGVASLVGAFVVGPRQGRFDPSTGKPIPIKGHSVPVCALGGFIILFGFLAFNGGALGSLANPGDGATIASIIVNTVVSGTGGAFITLFLNKIGIFGDKKWSLLTTLNGALTGMVASCAGVNQVYTWAAFVTGLVGGLGYMLSSWLVLRLKVDDPLDAAAVHLGGGIVGVIMVTVLSKDHGIVFYGDWKSGVHLAWQLAGLSAIITWTLIWSATVFFLLRGIGFLRVDPAVEIKGLDIPKHGEPAYPTEAYGHGWVDDEALVCDLPVPLRNGNGEPFRNGTGTVPLHRTKPLTTARDQAGITVL